MNVKTKMGILLLALLCGEYCHASEVGKQGNVMQPSEKTSRQVSESVYFRIGESRISPDFENNKIRLERFVGSLQKIMTDSNYVVNRVVVTGAASPDGALKHNVELAGRRAQSLATYLLEQTGINSGKLQIVNGGEDWAGLREMIEKSKMPYKNKMLEIMDRYPDDRSSRKHSMQYSYESKPWLWMTEHFFPSLRMGIWDMSFSYELSPAAKQRAADLAQKQASESQTMTSVGLGEGSTTQSPAPQSTQSTQSTQTPQQEQPSAPMTTRQGAKAFSPLVALKTDLMLWGGVMPGFEMGSWTPNLSAEVYFARNWSVQAGFAYSNWDALSGSKGLYAVAVGDLEVRHWFGKSSQFRGLYLGVYGQYGQYDVQKSAQGNTGSFWCAGLGAGWMQPLSRNWAIEGEIRGGYRSAKNDIYDIEEGHSYLNNKQTNGKFTPQLRVQVVYRFGKTQK